MMKVKKIVFTSAIILLSGLLTSFTDGDKKGEVKINWLTIEEALELSKTDPKVIFVDVYTNWCGWCKVMDRKTFANDEVIQYVNEHYYAVKMNAEDNRKFEFKGRQTNNAELTQIFRVSGFPTIVLINDEFSQFTPSPGFKGPEDFLKMLASFKGSNLASTR